jgi:hypothetical protein
MEPAVLSKISDVSLKQIGQDGGMVMNMAKADDLAKNYNNKLTEDLGKAGLP